MSTQALPAQNPRWLLQLLIVLGVIFLILLLAGVVGFIGIAIWSIWTFPFLFLLELTTRCLLTLAIIYSVFRVCAPLVPLFHFRFR